MSPQRLFLTLLFMAVSILSLAFASQEDAVLDNHHMVSLDTSQSTIHSPISIAEQNDEVISIELDILPNLEQQQQQPPQPQPQPEGLVEGNDSEISDETCELCCFRYLASVIGPVYVMWQLIAIIYAFFHGLPWKFL